MMSTSTKVPGSKRPLVASRPGIIGHLAPFLLRWIAGPFFTVVATSFIIFSALSLAPGDPIAQILGSRSTPEQREAMRASLGLDEPLLVRYWNWFTHALQGDLGVSLTYRQNVTDLLAPRIGTTLTLVVMATIIILVLGITLGALSGSLPAARSVVSLLCGIGVAIPGFVAASVLITVFAVSLGWFPTYGAGSDLLDRIWHLTLPALALSIAWAAYVAQITSAAVREEAGKEHVETALGRGIPTHVVFRRHVMRNAAIPILTVSGLTVAGLVAGAVIVESAFSIDGVGTLLISSVSSKDYSVVSAITVLIVMVYVVMTTLIDIIQAVIDPQMRAGKR